MSHNIAYLHFFNLTNSARFLFLFFFFLISTPFFLSASFRIKYSGIDWSPCLKPVINKYMVILNGNPFFLDCFCPSRFAPDELLFNRKNIHHCKEYVIPPSNLSAKLSICWNICCPYLSWVVSGSCLYSLLISLIISSISFIYLFLRSQIFQSVFKDTNQNIV